MTARVPPPGGPPVATGVVHVGARDVAFGYPGRPVLAGVSFTAAAGQRVGVVGENGSGKTTLLHLLAERLDPVAGRMDRAGTLALVEQELDVEDGLTTGDLVDQALEHVRAAARELAAATAAVDDLARGGTGDPRAADRLARAVARAEHLGAWDADRRVDAELTRLSAPRDLGRRLADMSVGERYRVRLACRLVGRADVLLLDEPTNHLDVGGVEHLTERLRGWAGAVVVVTHDRRLLDDVATAVLDLDPSADGRPTLYGGVGYTGYRAARERAVRRWHQRWVAQERRRGRLAERLDQAYEGLSDEWRPPKGSRPHRRATRARIHVKAADRLLERLKADAVEVPVPPAPLTFPDLPSAPPGHGGGPLLRLRDAAVRGRLPAGVAALDLPASGRLLVTGPNGAGKSTLLGALAGVVPLDRGERHVAPGVRLSLLTQDDEAPSGGGARTGFDAYAAHALALLDEGALDPDHLVPVAALGLLDEADLDRPLAELSVGQRRRFALARALLAAPHVLLLDEPTNHLSPALVDELTGALVTTRAAVVVATHDRAMRADLADWPALDL